MTLKQTKDDGEFGKNATICGWIRPNINYQHSIHRAARFAWPSKQPRSAAWQ